ncbi:hypothetical protein [Rubripirellula obstinata]|uniref:hypothetical protein n=1 Tax=Rubripirellula obstinata TaxID=406547 RepID=UPI00139001B8|nr:hypothetical protein [Rubripirellula obstinata]
MSIDQQIPLPKNFQFAMFILQFAMFDWFANNITHRIFISPGLSCFNPPTSHLQSRLI